ncbi:MAG: hypothetical protein COV74_09820 [Candidatus Omnitrophica bacterium CG11_big_fil_rev_8_21_14_0_20_45_26]|uniref:Hydroxyacid dehydrogenase n=1 Tax=Candidatus Abzuiibacterium crystallinum TaxID=1974748 RepID=A0A2H0LNK6_9BACT|nr:MAG: hypothetical protein COV74_09820 [Candidatus Omnitrophica bacterium CG11_big_fil_rev_8_21_14_0_20_45_26]PIW64503.1 MAG: hypothetical protein COW12_05945 [Candidatus Omnitrophica bacterium CG12_big_fil_rev_8_21_14_0_65_45_16]
MKTDAKIFVALSTFAQHGKKPLSLLQESGISFKLNETKRRLSRDEIIQHAKDCQGIIAGVEPYDAYVLNQLPQLECISRCGVGIDNIDLDTAKKKKIEIRRTPEAVIQPVVELTVAMAFDLLRRLSLQTITMKQKKWQKITGNLMKGKCIGVLGLGRIGKRVAEYFVKLGTKVKGTDLQPDQAWAARTGVQLVSLDQLLGTSDILTIHISWDVNAPFCLSQAEFRQMKKGAYLINVSRGQLVNEKALYEALQSQHLSGAALDVYPEEPYTGKLCEAENVVLTSHVATLTEESRFQMELEATQNLLDYLCQSKQPVR